MQHSRPVIDFRRHSMEIARRIAKRLLQHGSLITCALLVAFSVATVVAQSVSGTLLGTVNDPTGAVVQNATVTATESGTNEARATKTNESGNYSFPDLP